MSSTAGTTMTKPVPAPADVAESRSVRGRRSRVTAEQRTALICVVAGAAVLGAFSPGEPTGHSAVDLVYRSALVAIVALAGSRARRWTLVVGAGLAAGFGDAVGLAFGAVALVTAAIQAATGSRDRVVGAVIGALVAAGVLRLEVVSTTGVSAIVAALAVGIVVWSGYHQSARPVRRRVRRALLVVAAVAVVGVVCLGAQALTSSRSLNEATDATVEAIRLAEQGDAAGSSRSLDRARDAFDRAESSVSAWWAAPSRLIPIGAQHAALIDTVASTGAELAGAANELAVSVDYEGLRRGDGSYDLDAVREAAPKARTAATTLEATAGELDAIDKTWLVSPATSRLDEYRDKVDTYAEQTELAAAALEAVPGMLGADGPRRYLFLLSNPAELRDLGGHIGNWASLIADNGTLRLESVGTPLELSQAHLDRAVVEDPEIPPSLAVLQPARYPQNWGGTVDFQVTTRIASRLYESATGDAVDSVVYADPYAFAALLRLAGPVSLPDSGLTVTADTAVEFLTRTQFAEPSVPDEEITALVETAFDKFASSALPTPRQLADLFPPLVAEGRLRIISNRAEDQPLLSLTGLSDTFRPSLTGDYLAVVNRNANPSKLDAFLERAVNYEADWDPASRTIAAAVTVTLTNSAPTTGLSPIAGGTASDVPSGTNQTDLSVVTPHRVLRATVNGTQQGITTEREGRGWRHSVRLTIPAGETVTLEFELEGSVGTESMYSMLYSGQAMVNPGIAEFEVRALGHEIAPPGTKAIDDAYRTKTEQSGLVYFELRSE